MKTQLRQKFRLILFLFLAMIAVVAFGALYIANPDLVERFRRNGPYNPPDVSTFHNGGAKGYIDYPALDAVVASA